MTPQQAYTQALTAKELFKQGNQPTKEELKQFATKADLKPFATKDDLKQFATKTDLLKLKSHIDSQLEQVVDIIISGVNGMNENHLKEYHTFGSSVSN